MPLRGWFYVSNKEGLSKRPSFFFPQKKLPTAPKHSYTKGPLGKTFFLSQKGSLISIRMSFKNQKLLLIPKKIWCYSKQNCIFRFLYPFSRLNSIVYLSIYLWLAGSVSHALRISEISESEFWNILQQHFIKFLLN